MVTECLATLLAAVTLTSRSWVSGLMQALQRVAWMAVAQTELDNQHAVLELGWLPVMLPAAQLQLPLLLLPATLLGVAVSAPPSRYPQTSRTQAA